MVMPRLALLLCVAFARDAFAVRDDRKDPANKCSGIYKVGWEAEWSNSNTKPFTLYYNEWCSSFQDMIKRFFEVGAWSIFAAKTNMKCMSPLVEMIQIGGENKYKTKEEMMAAEPHLVDFVGLPAPVECAVKGGLKEQFKASWTRRDCSCGMGKKAYPNPKKKRDTDYHNQALDANPAFIINGTKYCEPNEIADWVVKNLDKF